MLEIFKIKNVSTGEVELIDFGLKIPPELILDLGDFDQSAISDDLDFYLQRGDIVRYIDGSSVSYTEAYTSDTPIYGFDTSTDWKPYTDSSLLSRDSSISAIIVKNLNQDASINTLRVYTDGSLNLKVNQTLFDSSIGLLTLKNLNQDTSLNNVWTKFGSVDTSLLNLGIKNSNQDVSLNNLRIYTDGSLNLKVNQTLFDSSVSSLTIKNDNQDVSLNNVWVKFGSVDTSLLNLGIKNSHQDTSLNNLVVYTDGSLNNRVRITGDTMSGNLTTPGILVTNDVSISRNLRIGRKINFNPSDNLSVSVNGDLWVEPSTFNLMYRHPILTSDASSYDLTNRLLRTGNDYINFTDSSTFTGADYILIEQAANGYAKRRINANAFATSITGGFGQFSKYDVSLSISSTTSTTYQTKLTMVTDSSAIATTYRVGWSFMVTNSNNSKRSKYKIYVDTSTAENILDEDTLDFDTGGYYNQIAGFKHIALSAGSHTIYIQYAAVTNTARIKNVRVEFWRASYTG